MPRGTSLDFLLLRRARPARLAAGLGVCALGASVACTEFEPGTDLQRAAVPLEPTSSVPDPSATSSAWSCLDQAPPATAFRPTVSYTVTIVDSVTNEPPAGLSVRACDDVDINCARPLTPSTGVSPDGRVRLSLAQGFDGFLEITSDSTLPTRLYPDGLVRDDQDGAILELIDAETAQLLAGAAGVELRDDAGIVLGRAFNCDGQLAAGVRLEADTSEVAFAFIDGLPIEGPTTGGEGLVVFVNVPAGFTFIEGTLASGSRSMGSTTAESRPGWLVYADVRPPP